MISKTIMSAKNVVREKTIMSAKIVVNAKTASTKILAAALLLLSDTLRKFDLHFAVQWRDGESSNVGKQHEDWFAKLARKHSGFEKVEILEGNIGYIDFWGLDLVNDGAGSGLPAGTHRTQGQGAAPPPATRDREKVA